MKKAIFWMAAAILIISSVAAVAIATACHQRDENHRLAENQQALLDGMERYRTADSLSAARVRTLQLSVGELEGNNARLERECQELGIKLKRMQAATTSATSTELAVTIPIRDTVYIENGSSEPTHARHFRWSDSWTSIEGLIQGDSTTCSISNRDTITIITHRVPRRWLFFKWGTKEIRTEAVSSNPHTQLSWLEAIRIEG